MFREKILFGILTTGLLCVGLRLHLKNSLMELSVNAIQDLIVLALSQLTGNNVKSHVEVNVIIRELIHHSPGETNNKCMKFPIETQGKIFCL